MNLFDFIERFPEEKDCLDYFISMREIAGIQCQRCGHNEHLWISALNQFECKKCKNHVSIKSGTVMENSKLPIKYWFIAIQLLTSTENITIKEIQEKISGADQVQVHEMMERLDFCLSKLNKDKSFDHLLLACIENYDHPPATDYANQKN